MKSTNILIINNIYTSLSKSFLLFSIAKESVYITSLALWT